MTHPHPNEARKVLAVSHTVNREGEIVEANGFKQPTPTIAMQSRGIWMHSIERTDAANPIQGFAVFVLAIAALVAVLIFVR